MIHYHGADIHPDDMAAKFMRNRHICVSFEYPRQIFLVKKFAASFFIDNGAFSAWSKGDPYNFDGYYQFVNDNICPSMDFAIIPDKIDGSLEDNQKLINDWPFKNIGVPVFHLHEPDYWAVFLCESFPRVAIGSSGEFKTPGTRKWWRRIGEIMDKITDHEGKPIHGCKLHGLRQLNPALFMRIPYASADSANIAQNIGETDRWKNYAPVTKLMKAEVLADRIESFQSPSIWEKCPTQRGLF